MHHFFKLLKAATDHLSDLSQEVVVSCIHAFGMLIFALKSLKGPLSWLSVGQVAGTASVRS